MQKRKLPSLVTMLVLTLITVVMWVSFDVYRLFNKASTPSVPAGVSAPLNPTLDQSIINQIESRKFLDDSEIPEVSEGSPVPTSINTPISVPQTASGSGTTI